MKNFLRILTVAILIGAGSAQAADNPLKPLMQRMGDRFQTLGRQIRDPQQNASSLELAKEVVMMTREAFELSPTIVAEMPALEQPKAQVRYQRFLGRLILAGLDVQDGLLANDNAAAATALRAMADLRNEAHQIFRPRP